MKILVIGRHGQLAQSLAERGGDEVVLMGRPDIDLAMPGSAEDAIVRALPDMVVNAAAYTAVDRAETEEELARRINVDAVAEIAAVTNDRAIPLVHISTDYVFDGRATRPYVETDPANPLGVYGRTKLAGEEAVRAANPHHLILRTSWLYSPFGRNFVRTMLDLGRTRDELQVVADQQGNPTSALDIADAILFVARRWADRDHTGFGETYHLAGTGIASWCDLAVAVQAEAGTGASVTPIATVDWPTPAPRPAFSALDCAKFARDFGHVMPEWRVSLAPVVARLVAA